jgi:hypothetical protein
MQSLVRPHLQCHAEARVDDVAICVLPHLANRAVVDQTALQVVTNRLLLNERQTGLQEAMNGRKYLRGSAFGLG